MYLYRLRHSNPFVNLLTYLFIYVFTTIKLHLHSSTAVRVGHIYVVRAIQSKLQ